jgi:hypothetical protein
MHNKGSCCTTSSTSSILKYRADQCGLWITLVDNSARVLKFRFLMRKINLSGKKMSEFINSTISLGDAYRCGHGSVDVKLHHLFDVVSYGGHEHTLVG